MLAFLCLYCLTFPPFLNDWFAHSLCFHTSLVIFFLVLSYSHCLFLPVISGAISVVNESFCFLFLLFLFQPKHIPFCFSAAPSLNPGAQCMEKIQKIHFHVPLGMSTIQFYSNRCHISTVLWGGFAMKEKGEKGRKDKEQRNHQGGFWKAAGSKSHPVCYNANTQKHKVGHC